MEDWAKKPVETPSAGPAWALPNVSARKRSLESAGSGKASKNASFQSNNSNSRPKKAESQPGTGKTPTIKGPSGSKPRKSPTKSLANQKNKARPSFKTHRLIDRKQAVPQRAKAHGPKASCPNIAKSQMEMTQMVLCLLGKRLMMRAHDLKSS